MKLITVITFSALFLLSLPSFSITNGSQIPSGSYKNTNKSNVYLYSVVLERWDGGFIVNACMYFGEGCHPLEVLVSPDANGVLVGDGELSLTYGSFTCRAPVSLEMHWYDQENGFYIATRAPSSVRSNTYQCPGFNSYEMKRLISRGIYQHQK